nr:reverse transcriptase domain-containing protein [Tanacetum cinerariifolium]
MTIEAIEQGKSGAYEINLRCNLDDGAIVLDSFCLKGPKPLGTRDGAFISLESIYETVKGEKIHQEKLQQEKIKALKARLNFKEVSQHSDMSGSPKPRRGRSESPRKSGPERETMFKRLEKGVFHRLGDKEKRRKCFQKVKTVQEDTGSQGRKSKDQALRMMICLSHRHARKQTFTPRICYFELPKKSQMASNVKTYDKNRDPEDHLKIFLAATKVERIRQKFTTSSKEKGNPWKNSCKDSKSRV